MKLGQKSIKILVGFLGGLKTPKFHSEINLPLVCILSVLWWHYFGPMYLVDWQNYVRDTFLYMLENAININNLNAIDLFFQFGYFRIFSYCKWNPRWYQSEKLGKNRQVIFSFPFTLWNCWKVNMNTSNTTACHL